MFRTRVHRNRKPAFFKERSLNLSQAVNKSSMEDKKLFGKYTELVMMLFSFILTGVVGTFIAQFYTSQNAELLAANKIFADQTKLIGDRYFAMSSVMSALEDNRKNPGKWSPSQVGARWDSYRQELQKYDATRGYNREVIRLYFGDQLWNEERDIHYLLRAWGQSLEHEEEIPGSVDFNCLRRDDGPIDDFLNRWHGFSFRLAEAIKKANIGFWRSRSRVKKNPIPRTPCLTDQSPGTPQSSSPH